MSDPSQKVASLGSGPNQARLSGVTGRNVGSYTAIMDNLRVGDRIGALVETGRLTFYLNGKSLGAACSGL